MNVFVFACLVIAFHSSDSPVDHFRSHLCGLEALRTISADKFDPDELDISPVQLAELKELRVEYEAMLGEEERDLLRRRLRSQDEIAEADTEVEGKLREILYSEQMHAIALSAAKKRIYASDHRSLLQNPAVQKLIGCKQHDLDVIAEIRSESANALIQSRTDQLEDFQAKLSPETSLRVKSLLGEDWRSCRNPAKDFPLPAKVASYAGLMNISSSEWLLKEMKATEEQILELEGLIRSLEDSLFPQSKGFAGAGKKLNEELDVSKRVNELFDKWQLRVVGKSMLSSGLRTSGIRMFVNNLALKNYVQFTSEELAMVRQLGAKLEKEHREMHTKMMSRYARKIFDNLSSKTQKNFAELFGEPVFSKNSDVQR